jgi:hypothetical protein
MFRCSVLVFLFALAAPALHAVDARSVEIIRLDCANELGRREVTLFANGTIRLREGPEGEELMGLAEMGPSEVQAFLERLKGENLSEIQKLPSGIDGQWIEKCMLSMALPDRPARIFHFGRYDTLPLQLSRVLTVVQDMGAKVTTLEGGKRLPDGYVPRLFDVLERVDGNEYRITGFSVDGKGVELQGVFQPVVVYMPLEQIRTEFRDLVSRRK